MEQLLTNQQIPKYRPYQRADIDRIPELQRLSLEQRQAMKAVSAVLPFRVNNYIIENLISWNKIPNDPIYQLTFPQPEMLDQNDFDQMMDLIRSNADQKEIKALARQIQYRLNPHPAGQMEMNVPHFQGHAMPGMQHKYRETILFFPSQGQTCHAYCTYCFRWAQFVGIEEFKFSNREVDSLVGYLKQHKEVKSVLFTGGDPLIMKTSVLRRYIEPLLIPELEHINSIRIGTKATAYWPYRFLTDKDADDLLRLFEKVQRAGRHLALMSHYSHPRELSLPVAQTAIKRIHNTGAVVRCQAPLIRHVNDDAKLWAEMWQQQVRLGAVPYYMFIERDTGPKEYFKVPFVNAFEIFWQAYRSVSGLARTVRGPLMSATPGKVLLDDILFLQNQKVFCLKFIQARDPAWVGRTFFATFDSKASWLDELKPAFEEKEFFFMEKLRKIKKEKRLPWELDLNKSDPLAIFRAIEKGNKFHA